MNSLQPPNKRKFTLLTVAFLLLAFAGVAMARGGNGVMVMVAVSTSLVCVRLINVQSPSGSATEAAQRQDSGWTTRVRRPIGIISITLVPIMAIASFFLYRDAVQGYHQSWPLYFFAATGAICAICWTYLISTLLWP
jgi:magnesium-transporting ATPase (P-type)